MFYFNLPRIKEIHKAYLQNCATFNLETNHNQLYVYVEGIGLDMESWEFLP